MLRPAHASSSRRSESRLQALAASLNRPAADVVVVPTDVTRDDDRQQVLEQAVARLGGLDVLVNNAGVASWAHFADSTEAILREVMEVNFFAPAELIRKAVPILVKGDQPAVVNVASMCGRRAMPAWSEYSASKYALCGLTEALRRAGPLRHRHSPDRAGPDAQRHVTAFPALRGPGEDRV